jgi:hypothetical protein
LGGGTPSGVRRPIEQRAFFRRRNSQLTSLRDESSAGQLNRQRRIGAGRAYRGLVGKASTETLDAFYTEVEKAGRTLGSRVAAFRARGVERSMNRAERAANSREVRGIGAGKERAKFSRLGRKFDGLRARARVTKSASFFDRFL